jgi:hypothetical protein
VLTILFAISVGAAIIVYAARPRQRSLPASIAHTSIVESFSQAPAASMPQVATTEAPIVETPTSSESQSFEVATPPASEVTASVQTEVAPVLSAPVDVAAVANIPAAEGVVTAFASPVRTRRAPRRKSTATTTKTRSRSSTRTRKS